MLSMQWNFFHDFLKTWYFILIPPKLYAMKEYIYLIIYYSIQLSGSHVKPISYPVGYPAVWRLCARPPGGRLLASFIFYTFYATYTTCALIFCAIIQFKKILKKPIDTHKKVWYNIVTARGKTKMILENWIAAGR